VRALLLFLVACARPVAPVAGAPEVIVSHVHPRAFALADGVIIWSTVNEHTSSILVTPRHGGASRTLVEGIPVVRTLVVHDAFVYFATEDRIGRIPITGGVPETLVEGPATDLAVTENALVWIDADLGLATTPLRGGEPRVLIASHILRGLLVAGDHAAQLAKCENQATLHGEVSISFSINGAGKVISSQLSSTVHNVKAAACILTAVRSWQFPKPPSGAAKGLYTITYQ